MMTGPENVEIANKIWNGRVWYGSASTLFSVDIILILTVNSFSWTTTMFKKFGTKLFAKDFTNCTTVICRSHSRLNNVTTTLDPFILWANTHQRVVSLLRDGSIVFKCTNFFEMMGDDSAEAFTGEATTNLPRLGHLA
eukprot:scaffold7808_cov184-Amphora_coffeaeformis.AAC.4